MKKTINVLFVCAGNICRSPMAEAIFQNMVGAAGLSDQIQTDSAGTGSWHLGETAHWGTLAVLKQNKIDYHGRARQLVRDDLHRFNYVLAMDHSNLSNIRRMINDGDAVIRLFLHDALADGAVTTDSVPDPYYNDRFDAVYELVHKGSQALLTHIRAQHNL